MISISNSNIIGGLPASLSGGAAPANPDFVSTWDTTQAGSASDTVELPLLSGGTYSGTIDWGDGNSDSLSYANRTHVYASSGTYTITISGTTLQGWTFQNSGDRAKITGVSNWGLFDFTYTRTFHGCANMDITATDVPNISGTDFTSNFNNADGITTVQDWSNWDMSGVTNYTNCFLGNASFNGNLGGWVHSSVTSVAKMFSSATSFNGTGLNTWDTSGVTNWGEFARNATSFNSDVSDWVVNGSMALAFFGCSAFEGTGCSTWDVSGMTSAQSLFSQCFLFSNNISGWDTSSCTNMTSMLRNCDAFDRDISSWDINQVSAFANFMLDATGLSTTNYDALLIAWDAQGAMSYSGTVNFGTSQYSCKGEAARTSLITKWGGITDGGLNTSINCDFVSTWDTTQAGSASDTVVLPLESSGTYSGTIDWGDGNSDSLSYANRTHVYASSGTYTITISGDVFDAWRFVFAGDRRKITDISNWGIFKFSSVGNASVFSGCENLTISATDAPNIGTSMDGAFYLCTSLTNEDFSHWDTSSVTIFRSCFSNCTNFNGTVNGWDTSSGTNFESMFNRASSFNQPLNLFDMSNATNFKRMFLRATSFNQDLDSWDVSNVTNWYEFMRLASAFNGSLAGWTVQGSFNELAFAIMNAFTGIGLDSWDTSGVTSLRSAFGANPVFNPDVSGWDVSNVTNMENTFGSDPSFNQDLSAWDITSVSSFTNFMSGTTALSTANYDALLVGWEATLQAAYPSGTGYPYTININFGSSQYTLGGAAETARTSLITTFGWTITDGGGV